VKDLAISADDRLLATVQGGDRYIVSVWLNAGKKRHDKLESHCTCPVGYNCKHAVAAVAEYLQALTDGTAVPAADPDDPRWRKLSGADAEFDDVLDDPDDGDDDRQDDEEAEPAREPPERRRSSRPTSTEWDDKIERLVRGKSREALAEEVLSLVRRYPELREEYREGYGSSRAVARRGGNGDGGSRVLARGVRRRREVNAFGTGEDTVCR
jgi:hypothetical protein